MLYDNDDVHFSSVAAAAAAATMTTTQLSLQQVMISIMTSSWQHPGFAQRTTTTTTTLELLTHTLRHGQKSGWFYKTMYKLVYGSNTSLQLCMMTYNSSKGPAVVIHNNLITSFYTKTKSAGQVSYDFLPQTMRSRSTECDKQLNKIQLRVGDAAMVNFTHSLSKMPTLGLLI